MAPIESPRNRRVPLLHFIIALLLVKSKPRSLSGPDFYKELVSLIKKGPRSKHSTQADAHIDTTAFWRNKSTGLEEENATLEAKVSRLQLGNAELRARITELEAREVARGRKSTEAQDSARLQRLKRRKDGDPAKELGGRSTKRARTKAGAVAPNEQDAVPQNFIDDETRSELDELGENLLDNLRILQKASITTSGHLLEPKDLALRLSGVASGICRHVSAINLLANGTPRSKEQLATHPQTEPEDIIEQRLIPIGRMFPHFLNHLHTLSQFSRSGNLCGHVIYDFLNVFRVLFQRICDLAVANAKSNKKRYKTTRQQDTGRNKQCATSASEKRPVISPIIMKICKLAMSMLFHLDPVKSTHKAILEGWFYLLVTRVGEVLKDFTVGGRPFGIYEDDAERQQLTISGAASDAEASEAQAPYLIWMLSRTLRLTSSTSLATNTATTSYDDHRRPETVRQDSSRNTLCQDAHVRLQHTLVRAVFGEQFAAGFEPAFELPPITPDYELGIDLDTQIETADVRDWFKKEAWRLVGWDVLKGNIAWD